jgi:hypothetical protein
METMLVRLKPFEPRRGLVLRRFTYAGIKFHEDRGWYRVEKGVAEYLRSVRERPEDPHSPLAFDVCTEEEALAKDAKENAAATPRKVASDEIKLSMARSLEVAPVAETSEPVRQEKPKKERG